MDDYEKFLGLKTHEGVDHGFDPVFLPDALMDYQKSLVEWAIRKGRGAIFADCGLGKSLMELVWAENVHRYTKRPVLILAPLAVTWQMEQESKKFSILCIRSEDGSVKGSLVLANYEKLHKFTPSHFSGIVLDESSILKNFEGSRKKEITEFMKKIPYRLLATATAAPNDYIELGTSSEALGYLGQMDMLNRFFKNDNNNSAMKRMYGEAPQWRLKGHSEIPFWRWVNSWARAVRKPSDLGFDDKALVLPDIDFERHVVAAKLRKRGNLFAEISNNLRDQREEQKMTIEERCSVASELVRNTGRPAIVWCHLNEEGDLLQKLIPDGIQVSGRDSDTKKEEKFIGFTEGKYRVLITKPKIGAWGMNWQHCSHIVYFPSHSFESYYQAIRRCWRFGQKNPVKVDLVMSEGEARIMENLAQKEAKASVMFDNLIIEMHKGESVKKIQSYKIKTEVPSWL